MSDLQFLYAGFAAFYLWECIHWLRLAAVPFVSWMGEPFHRAEAFFAASGGESGLTLAPPLPFGGALFVSMEWPIAVSPRGVSSRTGTTAHFEQEPHFAAQRQRLLVDGRTLATAASPAHARRLARQLNTLSETRNPDERDRLLRKWWAKTLDATEVGRRVSRFKQATRLPQATAGLLFGFVFALAPAVVWRAGIGGSWPWLLGGLVLLCGVNAFTFHHAHRTLHPELADERFVHFLTVLLFPPAGMRTRDLLSRPLLENFHPLATAAALGRAAVLERLAGVVVRDLRFPRPVARDPGVATADIRAWHRAFSRQEVEEFLSGQGLQPDRLAGAPSSADPDCRSYCPRCHALFTRTAGQCSDCGVALVPFEQRPRSAGPAKD